MKLRAVLTPGRILRRLRGMDAAIRDAARDAAAEALRGELACAGCGLPDHRGAECGLAARTSARATRSRWIPSHRRGASGVAVAPGSDAGVSKSIIVMPAKAGIQ